MSYSKTDTGKKQPQVPMKNFIGFLLSLILTFAALFLGIAHVLPFGPVMIILMALACLQIAVQLFFFMHFTESDGPAYHILGLSLGVIFTFAIVAGSIWVMTFNAQVH